MSLDFLESKKNKVNIISKLYNQKTIDFMTYRSYLQDIEDEIRLKYLKQQIEHRATAQKTVDYIQFLIKTASKLL